jgi:DNA recombination protein RmuC
MEIFLLIVCLLLAAVSLYLFITRTGLVTAKIIAEKSFADLVQRFKESELRRDKSEKQILDLTTNLSRLETEKASLTEALENRKKDIEETKKQFKDEFENLAHKIFETSRVSLTKENTKQVDDLLKPLREKLGDFQKKVEDTHLKDIEKSAELKTEIRKLTEMNQTLSLDAKNLTKALKGESKTQGNW